MCVGGREEEGGLPLLLCFITEQILFGTGEEYKKAIAAYNHVQLQWIEEMTNACKVD